MTDGSECCTPSRKRSSPDEEPFADGEGPPAKRAEFDGTRSSPAHLTLLEELCDLEGEDSESCLEPSVPGSCAQEDLVAEMMKSLEKAIEEGQCNETPEPSTRLPVSPEAGNLPGVSDSFTDLTWVDDATLDFSDREASDHEGEPAPEETPLGGEMGVQLISQACDDEFGILTSASSSDRDEDCATFLEDWASAVEGGAVPACLTNLGWMDVPLSHYDDGRDFFEPIVLF